MHIDEILDAIQLGHRPLLPESWAQGRTLFGGLSAAVCLQATRHAVDPARRLRNFEVGFARPFEALKPYEIHTETLGNGRTVTIEVARLVQDGKVRVTSRADYVAPLPTAVAIDPFSPPDFAPLPECQPLQGEQLPVFFQHFGNRVATAAMPFSATEVPELGGWMQFAQSPAALTDAHLVALIDSWPPTTAPYYDGFKPLSTISWTIHFAHDVSRLSPAAPIGYHSRANFSEHGISSSRANIWGEDGLLLASSAQTNIIYG